ncbi:MAG: ABC transporter transmembrane domain-containing protein [Candidatus Pacebacteria bacterium]|nr:ABC transporter transmembrane domain-containing protein [Candidatus Paceibacterota bacterium]MDD3919122.1 ABC transporter transmembrane domain-containing protein [Candidatus Paceibacterota bacterium]
MKIYFKALGFLKYQKGLTIALIISCFILACLTIAEPFFFKEIINSLVDFTGKDSFSGKFATVFLVWIGIVLMNILIQIFSSYGSSIVSTKIYGILWKKTFDHIMNMSIDFFQGEKIGSIVREFERGLDNIYSQYISFFRHLLINTFILLILLPTVFFLNVKMACLIVAVIPVLVFLIFFAIKKVRITQSAVDKKWSELSGTAYDVISNIFLVQSFTLGDRLSGMVDKIRGEAVQGQIKASRWWGIVSGASRSLGFILNVVVFFMGSILYIKNEMSLGDIIMFIGFTSIIINVFNSIFWIVLDYTWQREKIIAFFKIWETKATIKNEKNSIEVGKLKGEIEFKNVFFEYKDGMQALKDVSFKINPGEVVAFVGHTGSGKTTTANLISRFYDIKKGQILMDGIPIKKINLNSLRKNTAVVFQDSTFLNASFFENLRIDNDGITRKDMEKACKEACVWEVIKRTKKGLDQEIGEKGTKLSGGEKQRLSIARAILKDAPILILDEATSALDAKTEHKIQDAISNVIKNRTTIIIAHRLSTIKKADKIFVFEGGKIIETGNFNALMKKKGSFYELVNYQITI